MVTPAFVGLLFALCVLLLWREATRREEAAKAKKIIAKYTENLSKLRYYHQRYMLVKEGYTKGRASDLAISGYELEAFVQKLVRHKILPPEYVLPFPAGTYCVSPELNQDALFKSEMRKTDEIARLTIE